MNTILNRKKVVGKLGNMAKSVDWSVYPHRTGETEAVIQSDKRIAKINLETGAGVVSNGKGGHNGFMHLSRMLGAMDCQADPEMLAAIKSVISGDDGSGSIVAIG